MSLSGVCQMLDSTTYRFFQITYGNVESKLFVGNVDCEKIIENSQLRTETFISEK